MKSKKEEWAFLKWNNPHNKAKNKIENNEDNKEGASTEYWTAGSWHTGRLAQIITKRKTGALKRTNRITPRFLWYKLVKMVLMKKIFIQELHK